MRWWRERQSTNIEDRRGLSGSKVAVGGGLGTVLLIDQRYSRNQRRTTNAVRATNAAGVNKFQPRVGAAPTLGPNEPRVSTLKALARIARRLANAFSVDIFSVPTPGLFQPWDQTNLASQR